MNLHFDTSAIKPAKGYAVAGVEVEPQSLEVAGKVEVLNELSQIEINKKALERKDISAKEELIVDITEYLPEGIILADEAAGNIVVRILMEKAGVKTLALPVRSVKVNNASENFEITYDGGGHDE